MKQTIQEISRQYSDTLRTHRRHIHQYPELSFHETETQRYICAQLDRLGIAWTGFPDSCAVVATLEGGEPGRRIAFRADMDALCMQEENSLECCPYRSVRDGVMHACGHDGHTAVLLTLAEVLSKHPELFSGQVVLIFQDAEESLPGGAHRLVQRGVLEGVEEVYGAHLWPSYDVGTVAYAPKEMMASADMFWTSFHGPGGHGSQPHLVQDVLLAGCTAVQQYQSIVSREVDALDTAVVSVCMLRSGSAFNVIPDQARIGGTVRTFSPAVQEKIIRRLEEISRGVAQTYQVECRYEYTKGYPPVINDPQVVERACEKLRRYTDLRLEQTPPVMVAEDYSYYLREKPGAFFFIGSGNREQGIACAMHSSTYQMDEQALNVGLEVFLSVLQP